MSTTNHETSRKPSGSSSHSRGHSPSNSPNPVRATLITARLCCSHCSQIHSHRKGPANMFGVAMAPSNGLKTLNSGWQVRNRYFTIYGRLCANTPPGMGRCEHFEAPLQFFCCERARQLRVTCGCPLSLERERRLGPKIRERRVGRSRRRSAERIGELGASGTPVADAMT